MLRKKSMVLVKSSANIHAGLVYKKTKLETRYKMAMYAVKEHFDSFSLKSIGGRDIVYDDLSYDALLAGLMPREADVLEYFPLKFRSYRHDYG